MMMMNTKKMMMGAALAAGLMVGGAAEAAIFSEDFADFTGAGVSTGSGIPDFRGPQGVWKRRQPVYYEDFMASEPARIEHWDYKLEAWPAFREARPNAAHRAITRLSEAGWLRACVTQNIDGLHEKAGTPREKIVELHGTNAWVQCQSCGTLSEPEAYFTAFAKTRQPPVCPDCGGFLKPATISFGQALDPATIAAAQDAAGGCDLCVALGSTLAVYPAAAIPLRAAERGVPYIIVNRGPTEQDGLAEVTLRLEGDVVEVFAGAVEAALESGS